MSTDLGERRKGRALSLFLVAAALIAVAAVTVAIEQRASRPDQVSGLVLPGFAETFASAQRISVASAEASYTIERNEGGWIMRDRGDFPVLEGRLEELKAGLAQLGYVRRMTSDTARHDRLGVTDPREGGRGVLVRIENSQSALLVDLVLGIEPGGRTYVRRAGQDQVWEARGESGLPPLRDVASWLDLRPLDMAPTSLARVEIAPVEGRGYVLAREASEQPWRIVSPALAALTQSGVNAAAERLVQLSPVDVREAPAVQGPPRARVRALTFAGIAIDGELIESDGRIWLKLVARAQTPDQEPVALELNSRIAAWAYALSEAEAGELAPPLRTLLPGAEN